MTFLIQTWTLDFGLTIMSSLKMDLENEWISIRMDCDLKILNFEISKIMLEKKYFHFE